MVKNSFQNLRIAEEETNICKVPIVLRIVITNNSSDLQIQKF